MGYSANDYGYDESNFTNWNAQHGSEYGSHLEAYRAWQSAPGYHYGEGFWDKTFRTIGYGTMEARRDYAAGGMNMYGGYGRAVQAADEGFGFMMEADEAARYAKYWEGYAPKQVTPGIQRMDWLRVSGRTGQMESSRVIYDEFGRQIYRVDFSNHMRPLDHSVPHLHQYKFSPAFSNTGKETLFNFW